MPAGSKPLGEVLVEERLISREQLADAIKRQRETGRPIGKILLEMGALTEDALVEAVASLRPAIGCSMSRSSSLDCRRVGGELIATD